MTRANRRPLGSRWRQPGLPPAARLALVLAAALVCALLPERVAAPLKRAADSLLAPGQRLAVAGRGQIARRIELWRWQLASAEDQRTAADELAALRRRNAELETALVLATARDESPSHDAPSHDAPLVGVDLVRARVLGPQARSFLARLDVLDVGGSRDLLPGAPVFAAESLAGKRSTLLDQPLLDQGRSARLNVDDLALAGRSIVGRLVEVGAQTATMRRLTEPGYRDLVQLAGADGERLRLGAKGVLEGRGERLCRIAMVDVAEPVSPGDRVVAADAGAAPHPLVYGRVTRAERRPGDAHWQIWMEPAAGAELPGEVDILRLHLNPERVAAARQGATP